MSILANVVVVMMRWERGGGGREKTTYSKTRGSEIDTHAIYTIDRRTSPKSERSAYTKKKRRGLVGWLVVLCRDEGQPARGERNGTNEDRPNQGARDTEGRQHTSERKLEESTHNAPQSR